MKIETLDDLLYREFQTLYEMENRLLKALAEMASASSSEKLREGFQMHLEQTRGHMKRIEECFQDIAQKPRASVSEGIEGRSVKPGVQSKRSTSRRYVMPRSSGLAGVSNTMKSQRTAQQSSSHACWRRIMPWVSSRNSWRGTRDR